MHPRDLSTHTSYRAGRGVEEVARDQDRDPETFVTLSSNENPLGPAPAAVDAIRSAAPTIHRYPKAAHVDLVEALATHWDLDPTQVWLAAGADGALDYLARAMLAPDDRVLVPDPGFAYYGMSARYHHGTVTTYPLEKATGFALDADTVLDAYDGERIIYVTSPHNPSGTTIHPEAIQTIATETDDQTLVVVDEAYAEFATTPSAIPLLTDRDDIAVLRTFSKAYGLAGLRVGYALVPASWADAYTKVATPFAASELACRAGTAALADQDHVTATVELTDWARTHIRDAVHAPTYESEGNFVLVDVAEVATDHATTPASAVTESLQERGVLVRDCTSFGLPDCIRVSCGTRPETHRAVTALNEVLTL
ncbi:MAG: histidinol-phosphate transaminase [Halodesulfurarchaeum sp.]